MDGDELLLTERSSYLSPAKQCDLVMKGGITSGVVYPLAICRLATTHCLRQIGGTSAGAIAAATAAAAEYGRQAGGFVKLAALPEWLAQPAASPARGSNLRSLFQPAAPTRKPFAILMAFIERGSWPVKLGRLASRMSAAHPLAGLVGAAPGLLLAALGVLLGGAAAVPAMIAGLVLGLMGLVSGLFAGAVVHARRVLPPNNFGLCLGSPGLTDWLTAQINDLAGLSEDRPLTFGDLASRNIRLRMLTTCLTHGIPYRLPFGDRQFLYDSTELRRLFPASVVDYMDKYAGVPEKLAQLPEGVTLRHLPDVGDLPVIVAVRMSLSFPVLLSAVPLWMADGTGKADRVWFSDGGITSNFPVHFFDALLPTCPTFALNLGPSEDLDEIDQGKNIVVPKETDSELPPRWTQISSVIGFLRAVLDSMQNWSDNNQSRMPGYRDRIILILHSKNEGGANLDMDPEVIKNLSKRGEAAGTAFLDFNLVQHRWTRYRSSMAVLEKTTAKFLDGYTTPVPDVPGYSDMIDKPPQPDSHGWDVPMATFARQRTDNLVATATSWPDTEHTFAKDAPSPAPILQVTPDV